MLLSPHHFQQQDLRWDALLQHQGAHLVALPWGVTRRWVSTKARSRTASCGCSTSPASFRTASPSHYSASEDPELAVALAPHLERLSAHPLPVHVAICGLRRGQNLLSGELARYDSVEAAGAVDINTGEGELAIPRLRPRLQLLLEDAPAAKFVSFPLARITYQNGQFTFADYVPPSLKIAETSRLGGLCADVARRLREKAVYLAEQMRAPSAAERPPQTLERRLMVHTLSAALPPLEALLPAGRAHPFALYLALTGVLGQVAILGNQPVPPHLPPYDHNDPLRAFAEARRIIFHAAEEGVHETFSAYPFALEGRQLPAALRPRLGRPAAGARGASPPRRHRKGEHRVDGGRADRRGEPDARPAPQPGARRRPPADRQRRRPGARPRRHLVDAGRRS